MPESNNTTRLAVLEQIAQTHEKRITDMEEFYRNVVDRLDQKIQLDAASQINTERNLTRAVTSLEALASQLTKVITVSERADSMAQKHDIILAVALKVGAGAAIVVSAVWAVFKFVLTGA